MRPVTVTAAVLLGLTLTGGASHAEPFVGRAGQATGAVIVRGTDRNPYEIRVTLVSRTPAGGAPAYRLLVGIAKCNEVSCGAAQTYGVDLPAAAVTATEDMATVSVKTSFMGVPLNASWSTPPGPTTVPNLSVSAPMTTTYTGASAPATAEITVFGTTCRTEGTTYASYVVATDGYAAPGGARPPSRAPAYLTSRGRVRPSCAA